MKDQTVGRVGISRTKESSGPEILQPLDRSSTITLHTTAHTVTHLCSDAACNPPAQYNQPASYAASTPTSSHLHAKLQQICTRYGQRAEA